MSITTRHAIGAALTALACSAIAADMPKTFGFDTAPTDSGLSKFVLPLPDGLGLSEGSGSVA